MSKIKRQLLKTESAIITLYKERLVLWDMILPYMSEEFHNASCYIDVSPSDGLVIVLEDKDYVKNYSVNQVISLIENGKRNISKNDIIA